MQTRIAAILSPSGFLKSTEEDGDAEVGVVLEQTPFYAEQGGQVADTGSIASTSGATLTVQDTRVRRRCHERGGRTAPQRHQYGRAVWEQSPVAMS